MTLEYLISHYGYVALVIGTFLEGESILIVAGFAVRLGYLKSQWVILAAFAGSMAGDQPYFFLGRVKGEAFLQKRPRWETKVRRGLEASRPVPDALGCRLGLDYLYSCTRGRRTGPNIGLEEREP